jgi:hypothetical protein
VSSGLLSSSSTLRRYCYGIKQNSRSPNDNFHKDKEEEADVLANAFCFRSTNIQENSFQLLNFKPFFHEELPTTIKKSHLRSNRYSFKKCVGDRTTDILTTSID